jgi:hypothetical protein
MSPGGRKFNAMLGYNGSVYKDDFADYIVQSPFCSGAVCAGNGNTTAPLAMMSTPPDKSMPPRSSASRPSRLQPTPSPPRKAVHRRVIPAAPAAAAVIDNNYGPVAERIPKCIDSVIFYPYPPCS